MASLMTRAEAIDYLGISERLMCQLTAENAVAYIQHRKGGKMFFRQQDLEDYIERHRVPTREELARTVSLPGGGTFRKRRAV